MCVRFCNTYICVLFVYLSSLFCTYFVFCFFMFCSCFVVIVVLCIFMFVCTSVGLLPPGESPTAVSNNNKFRIYRLRYNRLRWFVRDSKGGRSVKMNI
jgi:uncharacterized membrane protein